MGSSQIPRRMSRRSQRAQAAVQNVLKDRPFYRVKNWPADFIFLGPEDARHGSHIAWFDADREELDPPPSPIPMQTMSDFLAFS